MRYREIVVLYDSGEALTQVGLLAQSGQTTLFEYDAEWIKQGLERRELETIRQRLKS